MMSDKLRAAAQAALEELLAYESNAWNVINDLEAALLETQMPTKICGPNLVGILNAAGFYRKKEWVGLTDDEIEHLRNDQPWWMVRDIEAKLREKNT
jgi:hypothetical protein